MMRQLVIGWAAALVAAGLSFAFGCTGFGGRAEFKVLRTPAIYSVRYYEESQALTVVLRDGEVTEYAGVPEEVYRGLMTAPDKDAFLKDSIIGKFKSARVEFSEPAAK